MSASNSPYGLPSSGAEPGSAPTMPAPSLHPGSSPLPGSSLSQQAVVSGAMPPSSVPIHPSGGGSVIPLNPPSGGAAIPLNPPSAGSAIPMNAPRPASGYAPAAPMPQSPIPGQTPYPNNPGINAPYPPQTPNGYAPQPLNGYSGQTPNAYPGQAPNGYQAQLPSGYHVPGQTPAPPYNPASSYNAPQAAAYRPLSSADIPDDPNIGMGLVVGIILTLACGLGFGFLSVAAGFRIPYLSLGIGYLIGYAVRQASRETGDVQGIIAGVCSLLACLLGLGVMYLNNIFFSPFALVIVAFATYRGYAIAADV